MPTETLRPNAQGGAGIASWSSTGALKYTEVADGSIASPNDATYVRNNTDAGRIRFGIPGPSIIPTNARIRQVRVRGRVKAGTSSSRIIVTPALLGVNATTSDVWDPSSTGAYQNFNGMWRIQIPGGGRKWRYTDIADLTVAFDPSWTSGATPDVYLSTVEVEVAYANPPAVTVTAPSGTIASARPTLDATYTQDEGYPLYGVEWGIADAGHYLSPTFTPNDETNFVYSTGVMLGGTITHTVAQDLPPGTYRAYLRTSALVDGEPLRSSWSYIGFVISFEASTPPLITAHPEPRYGRARLDVIDTGNVLSAADASFEDATAGTGSWFGAFSNFSLARSTAAASHGTACLEATTLGAGDAGIGTAARYRILGGQPVTFMIDTRAVAAAGRTISLGFQWLAEDGTPIGTQDLSNFGATTSTGSWLSVWMTKTAPANAAWCQAIIYIRGCASGEKHRFDKAKVSTGPLQTWSRGGLRSRNLLTLQESSFEDGTTAGWTPYSNCAVASSTTDAAAGSRSIQLTSSGAGLYAANLTRLVPIKAGVEYTVLCSVRKDATAPASLAVIAGLLADTAGTIYTIVNIAFATSSNAYQQLAGTFVAEQDGYVQLLASVDSATASGEKHRFDAISISRDPTTSWVAGEPTLCSTVFLVEFTDEPDAINPTWAPLIGQGLALDIDINGNTTLEDPYTPPTAVRGYRATAVSVDGSTFLTSRPSDTSYALVPTDTWRLKHLADPTHTIHDLWVLTDSISETIAERATVVYPLDDGNHADTPVPATVVTGGQLAATGTFDVHCRDDAAWAALEHFLRSSEPALLVSPYGWQRWVRFPNERNIEIPGTPREPRRKVTCAWVEVDAPA